MQEAAAIERAVALERSMARIRWFGIVLGLYQVWSYTLDADPVLGPRTAPGWVRPSAYGVLGMLALVNVAVEVLLRRQHSLRAWRGISVWVLSADCVLVFALVWIYSFDRQSTTWVIMYILGLEGALRFQLRGALSAVAAALPLEVVRDLVRHSVYGYPYYFSSATYRVGIMAIVASVAGVMARNLVRERSKEHEHAERERLAREESEAFHRVVIAGLEGGDVTDTCARVVEQIAKIFGYDVFAIALVEEGPEGKILRCVGAHGYPPIVVGRAVPLENSIGGRVASTGEAMLVEDVTTEPLYNEWLSGIRSEMCVPINSGGSPIGVINVESRAAGRFGPADLELLMRLAPQIGLVVMNARLLAQERATVHRLRELDQMKSDFVAITSHELRTPLTSIRGFVKTMRRSTLKEADSQNAEYLAIIDRQSERLSRLVEDLLVVSRIESGTVRLDCAPLDVATMLRHVTEELGSGADRVHVDVDPSMQHVVTDAERLGQVVRNLIENALKFSEPPLPVTVTARRTNSSLTIEVADQGAGIPSDERERIFDRFYQIGGSMRRRAQGAGLGLYIARWIVEALGGRIDVASSSEAGTTFTVSLPVEVAEEAARHTG